MRLMAVDKKIIVSGISAGDPCYGNEHEEVAGDDG